MAIFHYDENPVKRSEGKSVVNTAAYCEKTEIRDNTINKTFDYSRQQNEILYRDTLIPDNCPYKNAEELWNAVEKFEESQKAVLGQRVDIAIPKELTKEQAIELAKKFMEARRAEGRGVSYGIHDKDGNLHIDAVYTPRAWDGEKGGWGAKSKSVIMTDKNGNPILNPKRGKAGQPKYKRRNENIDDREHLTARRKEWEVFANEALAAAGCNERIDCRSLKAQREEAYKNYMEGKGSYEKVIELSREPTRHEYRIPEIREENREIRRLNAEKQATMREEWKIQKQLNWYRKRERNQRKERYNNNAKRQRRANAGRDLQAAFGNSGNNASTRPTVFTSLSDLKRFGSLRTITAINGLPLVSGRGMDAAGQRLAMLLQRAKPSNVGKEAGQRELRSDVRGTSAESRRNAAGWGGITFVAFRDLSQAEKIATMDFMGARKWNNCNYMGAAVGRERQINFMNNSFFMRSENGNLYQLHNRESYYERMGIKSGLQLSPEKAQKYIKGVEKASWDKEAQKFAPLAKMASKDNPRASKISLSAPSGGGKATPQKKSEQRIAQAKNKTKDIVKTPLKVCEDILTGNPIKGILKLPFRAVELFANAVEAGYNLMEAGAERNEETNKSIKESGAFGHKTLTRSKFDNNEPRI